jgi:4-aminobutyrate aminotransferase-like enzyme
MKAAVETADGVFEVDLDEEELLDFTAAAATTI